MAEPNEPNEATLAPKRKSDPDLQDLPSKVAKLATPNLKQTQEPQPSADHSTSQPPSSSSDPKEPDKNDKEIQNDDVEEKSPQNDDEEHQNNVEDDDDDDDDDDGDEEEEEEDRKGKGISREDKGKGKMVQEDEDDDDDSDDDSDDDDDASDDDGSDFSDDPLTEVDLNNILPSRTRGRAGAASAGVRIADDPGKAAVGGLGDDDDDSDDSDAWILHRLVRDFFGGKRNSFVYSEKQVFSVFFAHNVGFAVQKLCSDKIVQVLVVAFVFFLTLSCLVGSVWLVMFLR